MGCWIVLSVLLQAVYLTSALNSTDTTEDPSTSVPQNSTSLSPTSLPSITSSATPEGTDTSSLPVTSTTPNPTIQPTSLSSVDASPSTAQVSTQQQTVWSTSVWSSMATMNYSIPADNSSAASGAINSASQSSNNLALVLGLAIGLGGAALIVLIALTAVGVKKWRSQRSQHGVYNPSKQETIGGIDHLHAADAQLSAILKVPPEERLI